MAWFRREQTSLPRGQQESRVPEGLYVKCDSCKELIYRKDLQENMQVCPKCSFHFRISARERLDLLCDPGWQEFDRGLVSSLLVAVPAQPRRRHRGALGHTHDFQRENALQHQLRRNGNMGRHQRTPSELFLVDR